MTEQPYDEHYEWELQDSTEEWVAGGSANDLESVRKEGVRYLLTYSEDGPHKLFIRHTLLFPPMTQEQHPITPPLDLVRIWVNDAIGPDYEQRIATQAARWGADMELVAICEWLQDPDLNVDTCKLRAARRPNPKTLKERGREALQSIHNAVVMETGGRELNVLKEIVESLPD